jgi:hypothetical protein
MFNDYSACFEFLNTYDSKELFQIIIELRKSLTSNQVYKADTGSDLIIFFKKVYSAMENFFLKYFEYIPTTYQKIISKKIFGVEYYKVIGNIYSIDIRCKYNSEIYTVYYFVYKYTDKSSKPFLPQIRKAIIHIVPSKINTMTIYGLDFTYVCPGYFINKIFDYKKNIPMFPVDGRNTGGDYIFIGDIVDMPSLPYNSGDTLP